MPRWCRHRSRVADVNIARRATEGRRHGAPARHSGRLGDRGATSSGANVGLALPTNALATGDALIAPVVRVRTHLSTEATAQTFIVAHPEVFYVDTLGAATHS